MSLWRIRHYASVVVRDVPGSLLTVSTTVLTREEVDRLFRNTVLRCAEREDAKTRLVRELELFSNKHSYSMALFRLLARK